MREDWRNFRQIRQEDDIQGVRKTGNRQRLWEVRTQRLQVQKAQNLGMSCLCPFKRL